MWRAGHAARCKFEVTGIQFAFELKSNETWLQALHLKLNWIPSWFECELEVAFLLNSRAELHYIITDGWH